MLSCPVLAPSPVEADVLLWAEDVHRCRGTRECIQPCHFTPALVGPGIRLDSLNIHMQAGLGYIDMVVEMAHL